MRIFIFGILAGLIGIGAAFSLFDNVSETGNEIEKLAPIEKRLNKIYQQTIPAVVNVSNIKVASSLFYGMVEVPRGTGSGFVWDNKGHIVTNYHVIANGDSFLISFSNDKKQYKANLVGVEPNKDIAVLKVEDAPDSVRPIQIGGSDDLKVGQTTVAIGSPFGLDQTMTTGIVSATGRQIQGVGGVKIYDMIQTDAAINQGNSGGPLLNSNGKLIGMNTMIFSTSGSSAGLGFAVPVEAVKRVVPQLIEHGKVIRPGLGIIILSESEQRRFSFPDEGVVIRGVVDGGPAQAAGLKGIRVDRGRNLYYDVITKIDGKKVNNLDELYHLLDNYKIGDTVKVDYKRNGKTMKPVKIKLKAL